MLVTLSKPVRGFGGVVTALLNAIAEVRGQEHYSNRDYAVIVERIADEVGDEELRVLFNSAERLHANFYHGFLDKAGLMCVGIGLWF